MAKIIKYVLGAVIIGAGLYLLSKLYIVYSIISLFLPSFDTSKALKLHSFYRLKVSLTHKPDNKPVEINLILGCGSKNQQVLGEGVSSFGVRVPNIYGVKLESGEGVLVQTPTICGKDPKKVIPKDYMPLIFYAPDADDLEFMIAHVSTISFDQEFSKLLFHKATVEKATKEEFEQWEQQGVPNFIETRFTSLDFHQAIFSQYYPPENDIRYAENQITCKSLIRVPIPSDMKGQVRAWWPESKPRFWMPEIVDRKVRGRLHEHIRGLASGFVDNSEVRAVLGRDNNYLLDGTAGGAGIYNPLGQGGIDIYEYRAPGTPRYFGEALRIPYRTNTGYSWIAEDVKQNEFVRRSKGSGGGRRPPVEKTYTPPRRVLIPISMRKMALIRALPIVTVSYPADSEICNLLIL